MTAGTLKAWAQDDTGGPRAISNSPAVSYWLLKGMQPLQLCKTSVRLNKTYAYPAYVHHNIYCKPRCSATLQINEEKARYSVC